MGGFCGGISLGDAHDLNQIFGGIDLDKRPVLKTLVIGIRGRKPFQASFANSS